MANDGRAPVPAADLAAALAPFGRSRMLPREAYIAPEVFDWEQRHIFSGWTCVGHAGDITSVGAQSLVVAWVGLWYPSTCCPSRANRRSEKSACSAGCSPCR